MGASEKSPRPAVRVLLAIALVAGCTLAQQVLLTRLLSAAVFYHFSFLAVSLALLGSGAGAILVYVRPGWFGRAEAERVMAWWTGAFAVLAILCPILMVRLDYTDVGVSPQFAINLGAACFIAAVPFFTAGVVLVLAINAYADWVGLAYAADLAGAGLGAFLIVPLLWLAPAPVLMVALGVLAAIAAVLFSPARSPERTAGIALTAAAAGFTVLAALTSLVYLAPDRYLTVTPGARKVADLWTPITRVVAYLLPDPNAPAVPVFYDRGYAGAFRHRRGDPIPDWRTLKLGPQTIGYKLAPPGPVLVIGGGGGRDIFNALSSDRPDVDVIEINEGIRRVVDQNLAAFTGAPYLLPGVHSEIGDGRSVLARRNKRYAVIHIGFTDTFSSNSASAFALTESNLYTIQALEEYFDHLEPGGILDFTRYYRQADLEALRATVLTLEALRRRGVKHPRNNVVVILGRDFWNVPFGTILARVEPFTGAEMAQIRELAKQRGDAIAFGPGEPGLLEWRQLTQAKSPMEFCTRFPLNVCPPTDDRPFFFDQRRLENIGSEPMTISPLTIHPMLILLLTLGIVLVLAALFLVVPLVAVRGTGRPPASELAFFAAIGLGYMTLEIVLIQRFVLFLGFPTYALSVVLFALLIFTGIGSLLSERFVRRKSALMGSLAAAALMIGTSAPVLQLLLRHFILLSFPARVAISTGIIAPMGIAMGMAMPIGLRRIKALYRTGVPYAFGVNGVASVVGSVFAVAVAINFGFTIVSLIAAACYLAALAQTARSEWPVEVKIEPSLDRSQRRQTRIAPQ